MIHCAIFYYYLIMCSWSSI